MKKQYLLILCGLPFSGKTTLAQSIANRYDAIFINLDEINHSRGIGIKGKPMTSKLWEETYKISYKNTRQLLNEGKTVVYEGANFTKLLRSKVSALAKNSNVTPIIIHVDTSKEECLKRLMNNRKTNNRYDVKDKDFSLVCNNFQMPTNKEAKVLTFSENHKLIPWLNKNLDKYFINKEIPHIVH
jgi:predicted kinase